MHIPCYGPGFKILSPYSQWFTVPHLQKCIHTLRHAEGIRRLAILTEWGEETIILTQTIYLLFSKLDIYKWAS